MRPIKFRAWDKEEKVMIDWFWLNSEGEAYETPVTLYDTPHTEIERNDDLVVMQFIGITGMNKNDDEVDIFEGDIIQVIEQGQPMGFYVENEYVGVVEYDQGHCIYYLNLIKTNYHNELPDEIDGIPIFKGDEEPERYYFNGDLFLVPEDIQILGNIYENPELLKEQNKGMPTI